MKATRAISMRNLFLTLVLSAAATIGANAQSTKVSANATPASVTYVGTADGYMNLLLNYDNETAERFILTIVESDGTVLLDEIYADRKFAKIFSVPVEAGKLVITISSYKNRNEKKFQVTTERKVTEEVIVKKP